MKTIDMHGHLLPQAWLKEVSRHPERYGVRVSQTDQGHTVGRLDADGSFDVFEGLSNPETRLALLDEMGVDVQLVVPPTPLLLHDLDPNAAVAVSRLYNETISDVARNADGRFIAALTVPMMYPDRGVQELNYAVEVLGCELLFTSTSVAGVELDDPRFEPVLKRAADLGIPIQLHPCSPDVDPRLRRRSLPILLGNPIDTAIAAASLITGGVLDRLPDLRVMLVHGGGAFPYLSGRMDHGYNSIEKARHSGRSPRSYLPRFHYDALVHDEVALRFLVDTVGEDQVVVGTDAPYAMGDRQPLASLTAVGLAEHDGVRYGNALHLLGRRKTTVVT